MIALKLQWSNAAKQQFILQKPITRSTEVIRLKKDVKSQKTISKNQNMINRTVFRSFVNSCQKVKVCIGQKGTKVGLKTIPWCLWNHFGPQYYKAAQKPRLNLPKIKMKRLTFEKNTILLRPRLGTANYGSSDVLDGSIFHESAVFWYVSYAF